MQFHTFSSPHIHGGNSVPDVMRDVLLALIPGALLLTYYFGWGVFFNLLISTLTAVSAEALVLKLRGREVPPVLADLSAVVTAVLLALALPPLVSWWVPCLGALFAIVLAKHLYGGLGYNPFNPAMVGFVILLIAFPKEMTLWTPPAGLDRHTLSFTDTAVCIFTHELPEGLDYDAVTMATPLDKVKIELGTGKTLDEIHRLPGFGSLAGIGWEWVNLAYLAGGLWLIRRRRIAWQIPAGMLGSLFLVALVFYGYDSDNFASPLFHLLSGAAMLGAFFIATDPVTAATTPKGRLWYGAGIGLIVYVIRTWGGYPDGVAFGVLLMNMAAPTLDHYTQPRVYGEEKR